MSEVDLITVLGKSMREGQSIIASAESITFSFKSILIITDVFADSMPAELLGSISWHLGETQHAHTFVIEWVRLGEIEDVELDSKILLRITNSEEEPLSVPICVNIILENQVVFVITHFHSSKQIACLKSWLEDQGFVLLALNPIERSGR